MIPAFKLLCILSVSFLCACQRTAETSWPGIYNVNVQREQMNAQVIRLSYFRNDVHHDSGPFAVTYMKNNRYVDPFSGLAIRSSFAELVEQAGHPFLDGPGGSNEVHYRYGYGTIVLEVEDDEILSIRRFDSLP